MTDSYTAVWPQWIAVTAAPLQEPVKDFGEKTLVVQKQPQATNYNYCYPVLYYMIPK